MRALVLDDRGVRLDADRPAPSPAAGEVLVRVRRAGICATDLELMRGYKGFRGVLGHEFVGVALGGALEGRVVVAEINCACGSCAACRGGMPGHCPARTVLGILDHDGAFADLVAVPERNLHVVPEPLDVDTAVFAEPVAAAFQIPAQLAIGQTDRIVVLGDGRLGNLCAQVLAGISDRVTVIGKHEAKLAVMDALGIETAALERAADHRGADIVVDCTGAAAGFSTALDLVRPRGTIVLKTTIAGAQTLSMAPVVVDEITVVGSRCGPFDRALDALATGVVDVQPLISARFSLSDGLNALERAAGPGTLKVLLSMDE